MAEITPATHGGKREGAGRKGGDAEKTKEFGSYAKARAYKEVFLAKAAELEYRRKSGEYVPREAVRAASASAFATIAQTLRSIPDNIERRLGVAPEVAEEIGRLIDDAMADLAGDLERVHQQTAPEE